MSIVRQRFTKLRLFAAAFVIATAMYAMPMLVSEMTDLVTVPAAHAGFHVFGDDGCC
ncbi:MAG: hypothetical protein AAF639_04875 [Chloroflexota bacterium]